MADYMESIGDAAPKLGLTVKQLRRLADLGRIPFELTEGGHRRFNVAAVKAVLTASSHLGDPLSLLEKPLWDETNALEGLKESSVWREATQVLGLQEGSEPYQAFHYAFTEMVNNAIDHSKGTIVRTRLWRDPIRFEVTDDGVGAFARIRNDLNLPDLSSAIVELTKGKGTSDPTRHSGQGIFFTSKVLELFRLESNGLVWIVDNANEEQAMGISEIQKGTRVTGRIARNPKRTLTEIFAEYTDDDFEFSKTRPVVRLAGVGTGGFVSRSEAKLILTRLEQFKEVTLDFSGVDVVGQAFVDEVFRVWPLVHPGTRITPINMNPAVEFMVRRGLAEASR